MTLIVCDGDTERLYFETLRLQLGLSNAEVLIPPDATGRSPRQLVDFAENRVKAGQGYDRIYCVFDRDAHASFVDARARIRELANRTKRAIAIREAVSVPCWEVWVLLHFERTDAPFQNCAAVIDRIRTRHMRHYQKANEAVSRELIGLHDIAIGNAEWLDARTGRAHENPATSVHRVAIHLKTVAVGGRLD